MRFSFLAVVAALTASMSVSATPAVFSRDSQCAEVGGVCGFGLPGCCSGYMCAIDNDGYTSCVASPFSNVEGPSR
ncbi:uncharacterized protein EDB91DRAFT_1113865 [Suillus paluster]|uniref:uncharacterized protein n=1 Tax=Suillus paluster TaxID=48578 RepID=UPI001B884E77|nr:uncharacterized protein EDB91DRAFT_1113865 [Suillus paluster]KAG1748414.1 hypothetical protein EDB91DRAFT_1113865 [Suillus paluster]